MPSILQPWVENLGLRHQGVLVSAVRGCDSALKLDPSKALTRSLRAAILISHCGDSKQAKTFIEATSFEELHTRMEAFRKSCDHYPLHYVMHFLHAAEIIGYKGPRFNADGSGNELVHAEAWSWFYAKMCRSLHVNVETVQQLDERLNASEDLFVKQDRMCELENCH